MKGQYRVSCILYHNVFSLSFTETFLRLEYVLAWIFMRKNRFHVVTKPYSLQWFYRERLVTKVYYTHVHG